MKTLLEHHTNKNPVLTPPIFAAVYKAHNDMVAEAGGATGAGRGVIRPADTQAPVGYISLATPVLGGSVMSFFMRGGPGPTFEYEDEHGNVYVEETMTAVETYFCPDKVAAPVESAPD
jgi:hypothetical protein